MAEMNSLGIVGLGTMGANLARNAASKGVKVAVFNRTAETTAQFIKDYGSEGEFVSCKMYEELKDALKPPRAILIMVKAGPAVDAVIHDLLPHLDIGDILIDGGNSHYPDTKHRADELAESGIKFLGMGISGGEEGALDGPSLMPGGDQSAYKHVEPLLQQMAADDGIGGKCVSYVGPDGAGHFVKMVHNGIEYAAMQLIAESYQYLKEVGEFTNEQMAEEFAAWSQADDLKSYLLEITAAILRKKDDQSDAYLIDVIKDSAGQKGTGKWTSQAALELGVPVPVITAAVDARIISGSAELRAQDHPEELDFSEPLPKPNKLASQVRVALELSTIIAYHQGFQLMAAASKEYGWQLNLGEVARIWRGGCIIRSALLSHLQEAWGTDKKKARAARGTLTARFRGERQLDWRHVVDFSTSRGVPAPCFCAALSYFDSVRKERLPQNLIQAQRDFFGAHGYQRTDKEGEFHTKWG